MNKISIILRIAAVLAAVLSLSLFLLISDREKSLEGQILASKKAAKNAEEMRAELQAENASMIEKQEKLGEHLAAEKAKAGSFYQQSVVARGEIAKLKADLEEFRVSVGEKEEELSRLKSELIGLTTSAVSLSAVYSNGRVNDENGQSGKRNGSTKRDNTSHPSKRRGHSTERQYPSEGFDFKRGFQPEGKGSQWYDIENWAGEFDCCY